MHPSGRLARVIFLVGAAAAFCLSPGQPARAGDGGGANLGNINSFIHDTFCVPFSLSPCPQAPTASQGVLQLAAFFDSTLGAVRSTFAIPTAPYVDAENPSRPPAFPLLCATPPCVDPLNPFTGLPIDPSVLSTLHPLAFIAANSSNGTAAPTQLDHPNLNIRFYAVGARSSASKFPKTEPDKLVLFYEDTLRSNQNLKPGQVSASFSLPLTVLNVDGVTERPVSAILKYIAPNKQQLDCSTSTIVGDFKGTGTAQTLTPPSLVGIDCAVAFGSSGAVFEVSAPFLVTLATDQIIVDNPFGFFPGQSANAFPDDLFGYPPTSGILGSKEQSIGIGPAAAPLCTAATCPASGTPATPTYALCASLPTNGNGNARVPAVAAFYAIAGNGAEVFLSAPTEPTGPILCPSGM